MKELMESWNRYLLKESGLSRILQKTEAHDCAILSAFRNNPKDMSKCAKGSVDDSGQKDNTKSLNKRRNRDLKKDLERYDYGITAVDGAYIENYKEPDQVEKKEESFFVENLNDDPDFVRNVQEMSEKYCQDSVLIIPQGGKAAYLYGTNKSDFPGYGEKVELGDLKMGKEAEFMTRVNKRPFTFVFANREDDR